MDELIYLASPYTGGDPTKLFYAVQDETVRMLAAGKTVFCPIVYSASGFDSLAQRLGGGFDWYEFDLRILCRCDRLVVLMLDGWRESKGVALEIAEAERLGMPIEYVKA